MNHLNKARLISIIAVSGVFVAPMAQATNGYFSHGYSTKEKGLAGAGVAYSQDAMAAATNPAGMAFVGERMDVGLALFSPSDRSYTLTGTPVYNPLPGDNTFVTPSVNQAVVSDNDFFLIPQFAYNWQFDSDSTVGISIYGNGGMNTEYPASATPGGAGTFGAGVAGVNLEQLFVNVSFARKSSDNHAVGVSAIVAAQRFTAQGLENFAVMSLDSDNLSGNRHSTSMGMGFKLGYQGEITPALRVGVSYQSKMAMSDFDEYRGLYAQGGGFDIPSTFSFGLAYDVGSAGKVIFDVQRINYTDVDSVSNPVQNLYLCMGGDASYCLGGANGAGFGWEDMTIAKLGYEIVSGGNTYRFGYSKTDQPIPESQTLFNILAPATIEQHYTFGMTMPVAGDQEFNLAVMIAPSESVKGPNPFDDGVTQIELEMEQKEIQVGWGWKF